MSNNQAIKKILSIFIQTHQTPKECFDKAIEEFPEGKEFYIRLANAFNIKIED